MVLVVEVVVIGGAEEEVVVVAEIPRRQQQERKLVDIARGRTADAVKNHSGSSFAPPKLRL